MPTMEELEKKYGSLLIRQAQSAILTKGDVPETESVAQWLNKNYPKKKKKTPDVSRLIEYGVPQ